MHSLVSDWQLLADLSFADLVLWVPLARTGAGSWVAVAQMRPDDRARPPTTTTWSAWSRPRAARPLLDIAWRERPDLPGGRPRLAERRPGPRGDHPGTPGGPGPRRHPAHHQPVVRPHPEPARADLPAERLRPGADGRRGPVPVPGPGADPGPLAARRRRAAPARRGGPRHLRQPERAVGLPAARPGRRPGRRPPGPDDRARWRPRRAGRRGR